MLNAQQVSMINEMYNPKFMATADHMGRPNLVVVTSFEYYQGEIIFGNLFLWKSARNLRDNPNLSVMVINTALNYFVMEGRFTGFMESGDLMEHINQSDMVRYNAYTGFRSVGKMELQSVSPVQKLSIAGMLGSYLRLRGMHRETPRFPKAVAEKFSMLKSIKIAATYRDGKYTLHPLPATAASGRYLRSTIALPRGEPYAASVITPSIVSFQLKGIVESPGLRVDQVYATGLPVPGKLIYGVEP